VFGDQQRATHNLPQSHKHEPNLDLLQRVLDLQLNQIQMNHMFTVHTAKQKMNEENLGKWEDRDSEEDGDSRLQVSGSGSHKGQEVTLTSVLKPLN